jgi:hypothetical protein
MPRRRCVVAIGVNKTGGGLPVLEASAAGAQAFGAWLSIEGFEVTTITDHDAPVTWEQIRDAIKSVVEPGNCDQLVIYFSGHGFWKNDAELWLLTDAPGDANAAVSWVETAEFAKDCGIPNVVLISDACRSIPSTPRTLKVRGSVVFPNEDVTRARGTVDKFSAATIGNAAYELAIGASGKKQNVFTHCFIQAFVAPDREMLHEVIEDGEAFTVVPNRKLGKYLQREVGALLSRINVQLIQSPDAEVLSDDSVYIARARVVPIACDNGAPDILANVEKFDPKSWGDIAESLPENRSLEKDEMIKPSELPIIHLRDIAAIAFQRLLDSSTKIPTSEQLNINKLSLKSGFNDALAKARLISNVSRLETETGFAFIGTSIADALVSNGEKAAILATGDSNNPGIVRIERHLGPMCTVMLRFGKGHGVALAALQGFIGHVFVEGDRVINVSYVPSNNSERWVDYQNRRYRVDELRATASAATRLGVFRLNDKQRAAELAEQIRVSKGLDPSLGLYAAYAYSEAGRREDIDSILWCMRQDLHGDLFDVAMLARSVTNHLSSTAVVAPFCPMLTQGWNFLRSRAIVLPSVLDDAQDELEPALWTTFKPARTDLIVEAIKRGDIR